MSTYYRFKLGITTLSIFWLVACVGNVVEAQSLVPTHMNGWILLSETQSNYSHQSFTYGFGVGGISGNFDAFTYDDDTGDGGGGTGYNVITNPNAPYDQVPPVPVEPVDFSIVDSNGVSTYDALDRGSFGGNFNPNEYVIEVLYKTDPNNTAADFNVMLEQWDGFDQDTESATFGQRKAEQLQWGANQSGVITTIGEYYDNADNPHDSDGFAILRIPMSVAPQFTGQSYLFNNGDTAFAAEGDATADLDTFEDHVPNGFGQLHLQTVYGDTERLSIEVKDLRVVPASRNPMLVALFGAKSGLGRRFGTPFNEDQGGGEYLFFDHDDDGGAVTPNVAILETDQVQRFDENGFTNLIINTDDAFEVGGVGMWQDHIYQTFDGTTATLNVTAKLTSNNTAGFIDVVMNDLDGLDTDPNAGGEEYKYGIDLSQFNLSTFTTISIPLTSFDELNDAFETNNGGDGLLTDFNMYYLGLLTRDDPNSGAGLVGLEIESIQVTIPVASSADFDLDGDVDGADFLIWQQNQGTNNGKRAVLDLGDADYDGDVDSDDLAIWKSQYGTVPAIAVSASVPEPSTVAMWLIGATLMGIRRRKSQEHSLG